MKFLVLIALCVLSVQATDFAERLQKILDTNTEEVKTQIWLATYFAELNATNIPLNVKFDVLRNKDVYEMKGDQYVRQLERLITDKGEVAKKCVARKGEKVKNFIKTIQDKFDVCSEKAEKFCSGLKSAVDGEFNRILGVYHEKSTNIISNCVKESKGEDRAELCVIASSSAVKSGAINMINKLQLHYISKFDEIVASSYKCRVGFTQKDGLREKIDAVSKDIESCMKANS